MTTIAERVAAGAAFLDEHRPGWQDDIDLGKLDLSSTCHCVLGQLIPSEDDPLDSFDHAIDVLALPSVVIEASGFDLRWRDATKDAYEVLTAEWRRVIEARRAEA